MEFEIKPIRGVKTSIIAAKSKLMTQLAIYISSLSLEQSIIYDPLETDDLVYLLNGLKKFGVNISRTKDKLAIEGRHLFTNPEKLFIGDSTFGLRMFCVLSSLVDSGYVTLTGALAIAKTPIKDLLLASKLLGIETIQTNVQGNLPIKIKSGFNGGETELDIHKSNQFLSSLLIASPYADKDVTINTIGKPIKNKIDLTIKMMKQFGVEIQNHYDNYSKFTVKSGQRYTGKTINIEGDYTFSSYFFAAAAIHGGEIEIKGINKHSIQKEKFILDCFRSMGCILEFKDESVILYGPKKLKNITIDVGDYQEILPALIICSVFAQGESYFSNLSDISKADHQVIDELIKHLSTIGIHAKLKDDCLIVKGDKPHGGVIDSNKSRLLIAFSIIGLKINGIKIKNPNIVRKTFSDFWKILKRI